MRLVTIIFLFSICNKVSSLPWQRRAYSRSVNRVQPLFSPAVDVTIEPGRNVHSGMEIGQQTNPGISSNANFLPVALSDGRVVQVPKGFYYYTDDENEIKSELELPSTRNPMEWFAKLLEGDSGFNRKDVDLTGVYLPLPYGMDPINLQFLVEREKGLSLGGGLGIDSVNGQLENNFFARLLRDSLLSTTQSQALSNRRRPNPQFSSNPVLQNAIRICSYQGKFACDIAKRRVQLLQNRPNTKSQELFKDPANYANNLLASIAPSLFGLPSLLDQPDLTQQSARRVRPILPVGGGGQNSNINSNGLGVVFGVPGVNPIHVKNYYSENRSHPLYFRF